MIFIYMLFFSHYSLHLLYEGCIVKFLGINLDNRLSFVDHISSVCTKVSRSLAVMKKMSNCVPHLVLKTLYFSLVYPYVMYGLEVWGGSGKTQIKRLISLLDRCVKLLNDATGGGTVDYHRCNLLTFDEMYKCCCLAKMYKYFVRGTSSYFFSRFEGCEVGHNIETRFNLNSNLNIPPVFASKFLNSFLVNSVKFWNTLPLEIKKINSLIKFKKSVRNNCFTSPSGSVS